jgi:hypothetical protein
LGLVFHLNRDFPPDFGSKTPEQNPKNTTKQCFFELLLSEETFYKF